MLYSCISTLAIWVYIEKEVVFADISNPNTHIYKIRLFTDISNAIKITSKIIDLIKHVDEWAEIAISERQNTENEQCETLKKLLHKLKFHHLTCLQKDIKCGIRVLLI